MTAESNKNGATTLSRINLSGYVRHVQKDATSVSSIFNRMLTTASCLVKSVSVRVRLGLELVSGWIPLSVVIGPSPGAILDTQITRLHNNVDYS